MILRKQFRKALHFCWHKQRRKREYAGALVYKTDIAVDKDDNNTYDKKEINMEKIFLTKESSHSKGRTVHPGEEMSYTLKINNCNDSATTVTLMSEVPENTELLSGCSSINGNTLTWNVHIPAKGTKNITYTVKVKDDISLAQDGIISGVGGMIEGGSSASCHDVYIRRTFNEYDRKKLNTGIKVLATSEFSGTTLAKWIYQIAFSRSFTLTGTYAEILENMYTHGDVDNEGSQGFGEEAGDLAVNLINMTAPTLFGGKAVDISKDIQFTGTRTDKAELSDFVDGDIVLIHKDITDASSAKMYIFGEEKMWEFIGKGLIIADTDATISGLCQNDRFAVLRPSMVLTEVFGTKPFEGELTDKQLAVIATAEAYLHRGERLQYEDSRFGGYTAGEGAEYRWQYGVNSPEDCTDTEWHYSNCAAFCHDVYRFGLGYNIIHWNTDMLTSSSEQPFHYNLTGNETDEEKATITKQFEQALKPGDIIVIKRYTNNSGHAMLYCGGNTVIHSTGNVYNVSESKETYEPTARYMPLEYITTINDGTTSLFGGKVKSIGIVRPLDKFTGKVPENSLSRANKMRGIVAQKISSHASSNTANAGDEITYTFSVYNVNDNSVTVDITDTIPENTTYISGEFDFDGNTLSKAVTAAPLEIVTVSYKVRINDGVTEGTMIKGSDARVCGVSHSCPGIYVKRTLTAEEQTKLFAAIKTHKASTLNGFHLASSIYREALGIDNIFHIADEETIVNTQAKIFDYIYLNNDTSTAYYSIKTDDSTELSKMVVPALYGGRRYYTKSKFDYTRTRLAKSHNLAVGDIVFARSSSSDKVYIYNGKVLLDLTDGMKEYDANQRFERFLAWLRFYVVLRPSFVIE